MRHSAREEIDVRRRRMLLLAAGASVSFALPAWARQKGASGAGAGASKAGGANPRNVAPGRFFSDRELALLDELAEQIIPADDHSGGARAARVAAYIDARMAESIDPAVRRSWKEDLAWVDELSRQLYRNTFVALSAAQKTAFLTRASAREAAPSRPEEYAFGTIKWEVSFAYYTSRIGIHDDIGYLGNVVLDEFVGVDVSHSRQNTRDDKQRSNQ